jgi:hypothetical protein
MRIVQTKVTVNTSKPTSTSLKVTKVATVEAVDMEEDREEEDKEVSEEEEEEIDMVEEEEDTKEVVTIMRSKEITATEVSSAVLLKQRLRLESE